MHETEATRKYITSVLRSQLPGTYVEKIVGTAFSKGFPDLIGMLKKVGFLVEVKMKGNKPTALQWSHLQRFALAGGLAGWVEIDLAGKKQSWFLYADSDFACSVVVTILRQALEAGLPRWTISFGRLERPKAPAPVPPCESPEPGAPVSQQPLPASRTADSL